MFTYVGCEQLPQIDIGRVLRRNHHGVEADRHLPVILDGDLRLAVRAEVRNEPAAANVGQPTGQPVREHDGQRHQLGRLTAGIAEHQALVTRALTIELVGALPLPPLVSVVHALCDVWGLPADRHRDAAGRAVVALRRRVVSNLQDLVTDDARDVDVGLGRNLACDMDLARCDHGLDGDAAARIVLDHCIENGVADLVGHLVRVAFGDRLGSEKSTGHVVSSSACVHPRAALSAQKAESSPA